MAFNSTPRPHNSVCPGPFLSRCSGDRAFRQPRQRTALAMQALRFLVFLVGVAVGSVRPLFAAVIDPGDFVLKYDPANGNMKLLFTGTGQSGSGPVLLSALNIVTLGVSNPDLGFPPMPSGIPNVTPGQGGLNGATAPIPTPAPNFSTLNNDPAGLNGIFSEVSFVWFNPSGLSFNKTNPGVSDTFNLGNVAALGWSQANINALFVTDQNFYDQVHYGYFGYSNNWGDTYKLGLVQSVVPEPTAACVLVATGLFACCGLLHRRGRPNWRRPDRGHDARWF